MLSGINKGVHMFNKMIITVSTALLFSSIVYGKTSSQEKSKVQCTIIVAQDSEKTERYVEVNPELIETDLGDVGGLKVAAARSYLARNKSLISLSVKSEDGTEHNMVAENSIVYTNFNYKGQYLSVGCSVKK
jgi:hypothetical protein